MPRSHAFPTADDLAWFRHGDAGMPSAVRRATTALATRMGYPAARVEEIGIAVQEAAFNVHRHADDGALLLRSVHAGEAGGIELVATDSGPGIPDVAWASLDGNSTAGTLGIGLGGIFRLADDTDLYSIPGRGTTLVLRFRLDRRAAPWADDVAGLTRPITGETVCGDAYAVRRDDERTTLLLCDGLGHGPLAERAAAEAVRAFLAAPAGRPDAHMGIVH
ncbi:ATP-binding protein, partial [Streptomyces sp. SID3343]|uniref:ATP-binding protein n=1 Tax=Streptomyces sp. SID3343 TaxID=2690260 RepID=UPI00136D4272